MYAEGFYYSRFTYIRIGKVNRNCRPQITRFFVLCILAVTEDTICVGLARIGADDQKIVAGTLKELATCDLGSPLHSLIVAGHMHPLEIDMLKLFAEDSSIFPDTS